MGVKLNGSTGYLKFAGRLVSSFPATILMWVAEDAAVDEIVIGQTKDDGDSEIGMFFLNNGAGKLARHHIAGNTASAQANAVNTTTYKLAMAVFTSASSRTMYFGTAGTAATDTGALSDECSTHNAFVIGARNSTGTVDLFFNGALAEAHVYNVALTATDFTNLAADTVKPEAVTGWVDGWQLKTATDLTSIGGTRTLTLTGGVTTETGRTHPIARVSTPVISSASASITSATTVTANVTTDTASGTLYVLLDGNTTATGTTIAGSPNSQVITSSGAKTFNITGLTPGSTLYPHYVHVVGGVYSNVINGSVLNMPAAGAPGAATINSISPGNSQVSVGFTAGAANGATITGHVLKVYKASDNTLVSTSASTLTSPVIGTAVNGIAVYGKIESTNSAGTTVSSASGNVTPSATVVTSTITPPNVPLATAAGSGGSGAVWSNEAIKIVVINAADPTQANQVFTQTTSSVGKLAPITITGAVGFLAQVMLWRTADRTFLGAFPATSA